MLFAGGVGEGLVCLLQFFSELANDLLFQKGKEAVWFHGKRIDNPNTHGTGCTLSSAIASLLAQGMPLEKSVRSAKTYITQAIAAGLSLGHGNGPIAHNYRILPTERN